MNFLPKPSEVPVNFADIPYRMRLQQESASAKHWEWTQKFLKDAIENERRQIFKAADKKIAELQHGNGNYWRDTTFADIVLNEVGVAVAAGGADALEKIAAILAQPRPEWLVLLPLPKELEPTPDDEDLA